MAKKNPIQKYLRLRHRPETRFAGNLCVLFVKNLGATFIMFRFQKKCSYQIWCGICMPKHRVSRDRKKSIDPPCPPERRNENCVQCIA